MKTPKPKAKPSKVATVNISAEKTDAPKSPWKEMGGLPTAEQLSVIAATLSRNQRDYPDTLAKKAMEIWLAARKQIFLTDFGDSIGMQNRQWDRDKGERSSSVFEDPFSSTFLPTDEYPVSRDQFLQRMLAKSKKKSHF